MVAERGQQAPLPAAALRLAGTCVALPLARPRGQVDHAGHGDGAAEGEGGVGAKEELRGLREEGEGEPGQLLTKGEGELEEEREETRLFTAGGVKRRRSRLEEESGAARHQVERVSLALRRCLLRRSARLCATARQL